MNAGSFLAELPNRLRRRSNNAKAAEGRIEKFGGFGSKDLNAKGEAGDGWRSHRILHGLGDGWNPSR